MKRNLWRWLENAQYQRKEIQVELQFVEIFIRLDKNYLRNFRKCDIISAANISLFMNFCRSATEHLRHSIHSRATTLIF